MARQDEVTSAPDDEDGVNCVIDTARKREKDEAMRIRGGLLTAVR